MKPLFLHVGLCCVSHAVRQGQRRRALRAWSRTIGIIRPEASPRPARAESGQPRRAPPAPGAPVVRPCASRKKQTRSHLAVLRLYSPRTVQVSSNGLPGRPGTRFDECTPSSLVDVLVGKSQPTERAALCAMCRPLQDEPAIPHQQATNRFTSWDGFASMRTAPARWPRVSPRFRHHPEERSQHR